MTYTNESKSNLPEKEESIFDKKDFLKSNFFEKELKKEEYFLKLNLSKEERKKIAKILKDKKVFGEFIEKGEDLMKLKSLIKELEGLEISSYSEIDEIAKKIKKEIGEYKAKLLAKILKENLKL
jgi:hypothetical protein